MGWNTLSSSLLTLGSRSLNHVQEEKGEVGLPWAVCVEYLDVATIRTLRRAVKLYIIWQQTSHYLRLPLQAELSGGSASESIDAEIRALKSLRHSIMPCGTFFAMTKSLGCPLWISKLLPPNAIHAGLSFCISIQLVLSTLLLLWSVYKLHILQLRVKGKAWSCAALILASWCVGRIFAPVFSSLFRSLILNLPRKWWLFNLELVIPFRTRTKRKAMQAGLARWSLALWDIAVPTVVFLANTACVGGRASKHDASHVWFLVKLSKLFSMTHQWQECIPRAKKQFRNSCTEKTSWLQLCSKDADVAHLPRSMVGAWSTGTEGNI